MQFYFAPLEGIGGYIFRNIYAEEFGGMDKYFAPFIVASEEPGVSRRMGRELRDVLPENNQAVPLIPQILSNYAPAFLFTAKAMQECGYEEINLNLGCPSRTVVSKGRGAGFLGDPKGLDHFFEEIFAKTDLKISVKTRIGLNDKEELAELMEIFNKHPIHELIIHPRLQKDYYNNTPDWDKFAEALSLSKHPICYNGDIFTVGDYQRFTERFPNVDRIMLGRGILANPTLVWALQGKEMPDKAKIRRYHDRILQEYQTVLDGDTFLLFKMKELWCYMIYLFPDHRKYAKKIKKSQKLPAYLDAVDALFSEREIQWNGGFRWEE